VESDKRYGYYLTLEQGLRLLEACWNALAAFLVSVWWLRLILAGGRVAATARKAWPQLTGDPGGASAAPPGTVPAPPPELWHVPPRSVQNDVELHTAQGEGRKKYIYILKLLEYIYIKA
jgi:hypothetical protein